MSSFPARSTYKEDLRGSPAVDICLYGYRMALCLRNMEDAEKRVTRYHSEYLFGTGPSSRWTKEALELMKKPTDHVEWNPFRSEVALYSYR